jgi:prevent-host-death family protein
MVMSTVSLPEAQAKLAELIEGLSAGEEVVITRNNLPVARLVPARPRTPRQLGTLRGTVRHMDPDFDAPLDEFQEYMQ